MWRERIIETKKAKGIKTKIMSENTPSNIPPETITRILTGKTEFPRIDTILELGASVGLSPWELFAETTSLVGDKSLLALQEEINALKLERDALIAENGALRNKVDSLRDRVDSLTDIIIEVQRCHPTKK